MSIVSFIISKFKSLPSNFQPAILTASATLIGAFIGATVAQHISHSLTSKRENQKYFREIYQKLYAPILLDIYAYLDICTHFRKGHDIKYNVNEENLLKNIIKHIGSNLMFASPRLITSFNHVKINEYQDDFSGYRYRINELSLFAMFLEELYCITQRIKLLDSNSKKMVIKYMFLYKVWTVYTEYFQSFERASLLLKYKFYFNYKKVNYRKYKMLKKYYSANTFNKKIIHLINNIKESLKKSNSKISRFLFNLLNKVFGDTSYNFRYQNLDKILDIVAKNETERKRILEQRENISESPITYYKTEESPFAKKLFFFEIYSNVEECLVVFKIKVRNISDNIEEINLNNFKLVKFGEIRINIIEMHSGIFNGFDYIFKSYKLLPTEVISLTLSFSIQNVDYDGYILNYIRKDKTYKLRKISRV